MVRILSSVLTDGDIVVSAVLFGLIVIDVIPASRRGVHLSVTMRLALIFHTLERPLRPLLC